MIRRISIEDAEAVCRLCKELGHDSDLALIQRRIGELSADDHYFFPVYEDQAGRVLGFMQAERYDLLYGERGFNVIALCVDEKHRRCGIGRKLMEALEFHAGTCGVSFIRLNSRVERADAHAFYEALGYHCDKTQKRFIRRLQEKDECVSNT